MPIIYFSCSESSNQNKFPSLHSKTLLNNSCIFIFMFCTLLCIYPRFLHRHTTRDIWLLYNKWLHWICQWVNPFININVNYYITTKYQVLCDGTEILNLYICFKTRNYTTFRNSKLKGVSVSPHPIGLLRCNFEELRDNIGAVLKGIVFNITFRLVQDVQINHTQTDIITFPYISFCGKNMKLY
jgi:hypothetical protein